MLSPKRRPKRARESPQSLPYKSSLCMNPIRPMVKHQPTGCCSPAYRFPRLPKLNKSSPSPTKPACLQSRLPLLSYSVLNGWLSLLLSPAPLHLLLPLPLSASLSAGLLNSAGLMGRKGDGEPGVNVLWRGWSRLQDIADIWLITHPKDVGDASPLGRGGVNPRPFWVSALPNARKALFNTLPFSLLRLFPNFAKPALSSPFPRNLTVQFAQNTLANSRGFAILSRTFIL
jgi:hypothetical protein